MGRIINDKLNMVKVGAPYKNFSKYVLRTPLFPFSRYKDITSKTELVDDDYKRICSNSIFKEAIYLASPSFYKEVIKWEKGQISDKKKVEKLKESILKYFSRMSSRCTPYGLFAACNVGQIGNTTSIKLNKETLNGRHTRLDMNFLVALSQNLSKKKEIREQLLFYPNTSLYEIGGKYRYVEYNYIKGRRVHQIVSVDKTEYLEKVFSHASKGALISQLANSLIDKDVTYEEADSFIQELVSSQLLIGELEPSISGPEFLDQIFEVLQSLSKTEDILEIIEEINKALKQIDKKIGNDIQKYSNLIGLIETFQIDYDPKYLFQTDTVISSKQNILSLDTVQSLKKVLNILNKITLPPQNSFLEQFKDAFVERYEGREVSLSNVIDVELGIGYKQNQGSGDVNPLIDDVVIERQSKSQKVSEVKWSSFNTLFLNKLMEAYKKNNYTVILDDDDFEKFETSWNDFPDTFSCMIELLEEEDGSERIHYLHPAGASAANLLGRFCHGDQDLHDYVIEILKVESQINNDKIMAEIVHLPESRIGNVLMRPQLREYEIPYLARSLKSPKKQINLNDLIISVVKGKVLLKSKKYKKRVLPNLTNAHNYSTNSLPIYHFLSDMQRQGVRSGVAIDLGPFEKEYEFIPRIEYKNQILRAATWNLKKAHIAAISESLVDNNKLIKELNKLRNKLKIPQFVMLVEGDNELIINFENLCSVRMLLNIVRNRVNFTLREFFFGNRGVVKNGDEYHTNQIILSFYNEERLKNSV